MIRSIEWSRCAMVVLAVFLLPLLPADDAAAAFDDPLFVFVAGEGVAGSPPPEDIEGACGLAVDPSGNVYISDYYHNAVKAYTSIASSLATPLVQVRPIDPLDGPCGLAIASDGTLYVNSYHRSVLRYVPSIFPITSGTNFAPTGALGAAHPTAVAVEAASGNVFVNERTRIGVYDQLGVPLDGGEGPLRIGEGSLANGYGLAVSGYTATSGWVYVADAGDSTVKAYDPSVDLDDPVQMIDGGAVPGGSFVSLRDSALAVDRVNGDVYVADNLQPGHTEQPETAIYVFGHNGTYKGRLKHNVVNGSPPGLAVDNSATANQGRVYVTSGNTRRSKVYVYPPNAATTAVIPVVPPSGPQAGGAGGMEGAITSNANVGGAVSALHGASAGASDAKIVQQGNLRVNVAGDITPRRLPRKGVAPVAVSVGGKIATTDGSSPPQLRGMRIELNRHGRLETKGLATCAYRSIQPASTARALAACREALVGRGRFTAEITLSGQEPYPTSGQMLLFNGRRGKAPVLFGQIYSRRPFTTSFVIVFTIRQGGKGTYGTVLSASLPRALGGWGNLTGIEMTLKRRYSHRGVSRSFISAGCNAPSGFPGAIFPLARTSFSFAGGKKLSSVLVSNCNVRR